MGAIGKIIATLFKTVGDATQKCSPCLAGGLRVGGECFASELCGAIEFLQSCGAVYGLNGLTGGGGECLKAGTVARATFKADEGESSEVHDCFSVSEFPGASVSGLFEAV